MTCRVYLSVLLLALSMNALAFLGFGNSASWKEEVLLHDGTKIIVDRSVNRGGRHEIGQRPPFKEQVLKFKLPSTNQYVTWEDHYNDQVGSANFLPMVLDIVMNTPYILAFPMGCRSYNIWGRPNPPYVTFKFDGKEWKQIPLEQLPVEIKTPNLIFSSPDSEVERIGKSLISAETIAELVASYRQPEYRSILREPLPKERINEMCMEMILYKGYWIMPNDPVGRELADRWSKSK